MITKELLIEKLRVLVERYTIDTLLFTNIINLLYKNNTVGCEFNTPNSDTVDHVKVQIVYTMITEEPTVYVTEYKRNAGCRTYHVYLTE